MMLNELGATIRRLRKERGLTMRELAVRAQLTTSTICYAENNSHKGIQLYTLLCIAKSLDISVSDLLRDARL